MALNVRICLPPEQNQHHSLDTSLLPRVYSGRRIHGTIEILSSNGAEPLFDSTEVTFEGNLTSRIHNAIVGDRQSWSATQKKQLIQLTDCLPLSKFHCPPQPVPGSLIHAHFYFDIPDIIAEPAFDKEGQISTLHSTRDHNILPPSLSFRKAYSAGQGPSDRGDGISGTCDIAYQITARLVYRGVVVARTALKVQFIPVTETAPPLCTMSYPGEFQLSDSASILEILKLRRQGKVSVSVVEPSPLVLSYDQPISLSSTSLPLRFEVRRSKNMTGVPAFTKNPPDLGECTVSCSLEAITYFSILKLKTALSKKEAARLPYVARQDWRSKPQTRKLRLSNWKEAGADDGNSTTTVWETHTPVHVSPQSLLDSSAYILPTFRSPFVSRRYTLDVKIKVRSGGGSVSGIGGGKEPYLRHLASLELRVPVQLCYGGENHRKKPTSLPFELGLGSCLNESVGGCDCERCRLESQDIQDDDGGTSGPPPPPHPPPIYFGARRSQCRD